MAKIFIPILTALLFAGSFIAGKYTTHDLGPLTTSLSRAAVALAFLALLIPYFGTSRLRTAKSDLIKFVILGLSGIAAYHFFFFLALRHTAVANTAIINALSPIVTGLMAAWLLSEQLSRRNYLGILLAAAGVLLLLTRGDPHKLLALDFAAGDLLMLAAVGSWVVYALLVKSLSGRYHSFTITFYALLYGTCALVPLAVPEAFWAQLASISSASIYAVLYMGIGASGLGYLCYNLSVGAIGPTRTSSFVYSTVPVFVAILSWMFLREPITAIMIVSAGMILLGLRATLRH